MTDSISQERLNLLYRVHWDAPLGEGGFGAVYSATDQATGERVACKQMSKQYTDDMAFQREIEAFLHLREHGGHPNICTLRETFDEGSDYYLILDLISGGEMFDHLINK
jgi:serine/threonine protein kinase